MHYFERDLPVIEQWIADLGGLAPVAFIALYIKALQAHIPDEANL